MSDLSHRLRESAKATFYDPLKSELNEAASHIEKLEAKNKKLKDAMLGIIDLCEYGVQRTPSWCSEPEGYCACVKAFGAMDYDLSNMNPID